MRRILTKIGAPILVGLFTLTLATGCAPKTPPVDTSACNACSANAGKVDAAASRAEAAASRAEAAAQRAEAAAQKAEAMFSKSVRK
jgi:Alanine-zipper, major outer membrane lipoprotein